MKRTIVLLLVLALTAAACGDDEAATLDTCEGVADATIDLVQEVIDELESMSPEDTGALFQGQEFPAFTEIGNRGAELGQKAQELSCTELDALVAARADQLKADPTSAFSQLIVEGTRNGEDVLGRLFR